MAKKIKLNEWDAAEHLKTDEDMAAYLNACIAEDSGDGSLIRVALGDIARARGMSELARNTGLARESLYRALSANGNPEFSTVMKVLQGLNLKIKAESFYSTKNQARLKSAVKQLEAEKGTIHDLIETGNA